MPAYVIIHRSPEKLLSEFTLYVAVTDTPEQACAAVEKKFELEGECEVNGKPLTEATASALGLSVGDVRTMQGKLACE